MDQLEQAISDIEEAGYDVRETLTGYLTVETTFLGREGATGDGYCWSHSGPGRGGWCCYACWIGIFFEALIAYATCPFCPFSDG